MTVQQLQEEKSVCIFPFLATKEAKEERLISEVIYQIYQNPKAELIQEARASGKGTDKYDQIKRYQTESVRWAFQDPSRENGHKMEHPTGLIYIDIDPEEMQGISPTDTAETNDNLRKLFSLPYVTDIWRSFGADGLGLLCYAEGYDHDTYAEYYHDIAAHILQETGIMCDIACADPTRLNVISSDANIMHKAGEVTPYTLNKYQERYSDPSNNVFKQFNADSESDLMTKVALESAGWRNIKGEYWVRPGKSFGISAQWNKHGRYEGKIKIFTTSTELESGMYDKAEIVKQLTYQGDGKSFSKFLYSRYKVKGTAENNSTVSQPKRNTGYIPEGEPDEIDAMIDKLELTGEVQIIDMKEHFGCFNIFPPALGNALEDYAEASGLSREYIMHAVLFAISTLTQGKVILNVNKGHGYQETPTFWGITLGEPGDAKSPVHKMLMKPLLEKIQFFLNEDYERALDEYEAYQEMSAKEKNNEGMAQHSKPPKMKQILGTSGTIEGYIKVLKDTGSTGRFTDEISGFFNEMNSHRGGSGSDIDTYLSLFNASAINKNLVRERIYIKRPFFPLSGTGTTKNILKILQKEHAESGMYERFTYWIKPQTDPETIQPKAIKSRLSQSNTEESKAQTALATWSQFCEKMFHYFNPLDSDSPIILNYDNESIQQLEEMEKWFAEQEAEFRREGKDTMVSLYAKIKIYFYRLPILFWASRIFGTKPKEDMDFNTLDNNTIRIADIYAAQNIITYLISTYEYVHDSLFNIHDPNTLDSSQVKEYRKRLTKELVKVNKGASWRNIADAVNRLTKGFKPVAHTTCRYWCR